MMTTHKILLGLTLALCLLSSCSLFGNKLEPDNYTVGWLTNFYRGYMQDILSEGEIQTKLDTVLTPELNEKRERHLDYNYIIAGQDVIPEMISTLSVERIAEDWYKVYYYTQAEGLEGALQEMAITLKMQGGRIAELYPYPVDHEALDKIKHEPKPIVHSSPKAFIESFYHNYLGIYVTMPLELQRHTAKMREEHCTSWFVDKHRRMRDVDFDGSSLFDTLIAAWDFDKVSLASFEIKQVSEHFFKLSYSDGYGDEFVYHVILAKEGDRYKIDDVDLGS